MAMGVPSNAAPGPPRRRCEDAVTAAPPPALPARPPGNDHQHDVPGTITPADLVQGPARGSPPPRPRPARRPRGARRAPGGGYPHHDQVVDAQAGHQARPQPRAPPSPRRPGSAMCPSTARTGRRRRPAGHSQRRRHRRGVGVVGVVHDLQAVGRGRRLHPPGRDPRVLQRRRDLGERDLEPGGHRDSRPARCGPCARPGTPSPMRSRSVPTTAVNDASASRSTSTSSARTSASRAVPRTGPRERPCAPRSRGPPGRPR